MIVVQFKHNEEGVFTLSPTDELGQPVTLTGVPKWEISADPNGVLRGDVFPSTDGLTCVVPAKNEGGTGTGAQIKVKLYEETDDGVETLEDTADITIVGFVAVNTGLGFTSRPISV